MAIWNGMTRMRFVALLALMLVALGLAACGDDDDDDDDAATNTPGDSTTTEDAGGSATGGPAITLKIGSMEDLSGANASGVLITAEGQRFAVDQINEAGGFEIDGQRYLLEVEERDTRSDPSVAASAAQELINDVGVIAMFGTQLGTGISSIPVTQEAGVIHFMTPSSVEAELDNPDNCCLFRSSISNRYRDPIWLQGGTDMLHDADPSLTTVAFIQQNNNLFQDLVATWSELATESGLEVVDTQFYEPGTTDFSGLVSAVSGQDPDIIFGPPIVADVQAIIRQANELGVGRAFIFPAVPLTVGSDALGGPMDEPLVSLYTGPNTTQPSTPEIQQFIDDWVEWRGGDMPAENPQSVFFFYDSVYQLVEAMKEAGCVPESSQGRSGPDECTTAVVEALETNPYTGVYGDIQYDDTHRVRYPIDICRIVGEEIECQNFEPEA